TSGAPPFVGSPWSVHASIERCRASLVFTMARARRAGSRGIGWSGKGRRSEAVGGAGSESRGVRGRVDVTGGGDERWTAVGASPGRDEQPASTSAMVTPATARLIIWAMT
ncbi:MAG TPA: hypothetical protein VGR13_03130, partial [Actinomycetota bacterium]|nr:hypothetical protein [Actinomycetota bacterium]